MNTTPLYIFDLDGTLADLKHRRHFVEYPLIDCNNCGHQHNARKCRMCETEHPFKPDWNTFHAACVDDTPIRPVINTLTNFRMAECEVWIWSGRMSTVLAETRQWLMTHVGLTNANELRMRPTGNFTPDDQLKESWLLTMSPEDRARLVMVFDDRDRVVNMWRRNGIVCAQVAPGDF